MTEKELSVGSRVQPAKIRVTSNGVKRNPVADVVYALCPRTLLGLGAVFFGSTLAACGTRSEPSDTFVATGGTCAAKLASFATDPRDHVPQGSTLAEVSNPPCGGPHYPFWISWGPHETPVPRGNYIHNQEHGGVILLYRCATRAACPEIAGQLESFANKLPRDPSCAGVPRRVVISPDPLLPAGVTVAAAAWGATYTAGCVDEAALKKFFEAHVGRGPEDLCAEGVATPPDTDSGVPPMMDAGEPSFDSGPFSSDAL